MNRRAFSPRRVPSRHQQRFLRRYVGSMATRPADASLASEAALRGDLPPIPARDGRLGAGPAPRGV
jgi:hypothetical protein